MTLCFQNGCQEGIETQNYYTQFISQKHAYTYTIYKCVLCLLCKQSLYGVILWIWYFYWALLEKKINIHYELVTSQTHWFFGSKLDFSKFSIFNNFLVYSSICMKFAPKSLVLEKLSFWLWLTVSDPFPLKKRNQPHNIRRLTTFLYRRYLKHEVPLKRYALT